VKNVRNAGLPCINDFYGRIVDKKVEQNFWKEGDAYEKIETTSGNL